MRDCSPLAHSAHARLAQANDRRALVRAVAHRMIEGITS